MVFTGKHVTNVTQTSKTIFSNSWYYTSMLDNESYFAQTLKKSKKETWLVWGPYTSILSRKKKKFVREAFNRSGWRRERATRSRRSGQLSRPRQNPHGRFSFQAGPLFPCTERRSRVTLHRMHPKRWQEIGAKSSNCDKLTQEMHWWLEKAPKSYLTSFLHILNKHVHCVYSDNERSQTWQY